MDKHPLQQLCEDIDIDCRSYSGRAMYGKECLGIDVDRLGLFIASVITGMQDVHMETDPDLAGAVAEAFEGMRTDQMGLGTIIYFPGIPFVTGDEDDDSENEA